MRPALRALALALLLALPLFPAAGAHTSNVPGPGTSDDPWVGHMPPANYSRIERLSFEKGMFFTYHRQVYDTVEPKRYSVLGLETIQIYGITRPVILYGFDNNDPARGSRSAYIEYRDAETFDIFKIHDFGYSTDKSGRVGRDVLKVFDPPYREGIFPMSVGDSWENNVTVTETRSMTWVDPIQGPKNISDTARFRVMNYGAVTQTVNLTIAGRNVTSLQTLTVDRVTNRSDRHNWVPTVPVPVRIVRYEGFGANATALETLKLIEFVLGPVPEVAPIATPSITRVNTPVKLTALGADPGHRLLSYAWGFGDPSSGAANRFSANAPTDGHYPDGQILPTIEHSWKKPGVYKVQLVVAITGGFILNRSIDVTVLNDPPVIVFTQPQDVPLDEDIVLDASDSYDAEGPLTGFRWRFTDNVTLDGPVVTRRFSAPETSGILTVTDDSGATTTREFTVRVAQDGSGTTGSVARGDRLGPALTATFQEVQTRRLLWANLTASDPDGVAYVTFSLNGIPLYTNKTTRPEGIPTEGLKTGVNRFTASAWDKAGARSTMEWTYTYTPPVTNEGPKPWLDRIGGVPKANDTSTSDAGKETGWFSIPAAPTVLALLAVAATAVAARRRRA